MDTGSTLSPAQLHERAMGITATDIAAIVGVHPYRSAVDVWSEKLGHAQRFEGNERTKWGNILEPVIRRDYEERKGVRVEVHGTHTHPERPWMMASPDGLVYYARVEPELGLEIKCHTIYLRHLYGAPGSDEVPQYELCQCAWGMAVTGLPRWDLVAFIDGQPTEYTIDRDLELEAMLIERADKFRRDCILGGTPPEPDGTDAYSEWLATRHKADNKLGALINVAGEEQTMRLVHRLRELRNEIALREAEEEQMVQGIKARIGDAAGIEWPSGKPAPTKGKDKGILPTERITWRKSADSTWTDYRGTLEAARLKAQIVAGGKADEIRRATIVLDKFAGDTFANSRATMTAGDIRDLISTMADTLGYIAKLEPFTGTRIGSRQFRVPQNANWKALHSDKSGA